MGSAEFNRRWKLFFNGLVQALYSGAISGLAIFTANGIFVLSMPPAAMGAMVLAVVIAHLIGYFQKSPLPDLFEVASPATMAEVKEVVEATEKRVEKITDKASEEIADIVNK